MEVEGPEDPVVFLEQAVNKDASGQESAPGIVPDGKRVSTMDIVCFLEKMCVCSEHVNVC